MYGGIIGGQAFFAASLGAFVGLHFFVLVQHMMPGAGVFVFFGEEEQGDSSNAFGLMEHSSGSFGSRVDVVDELKPCSKGAHQLVVAVGESGVDDAAHFVDHGVWFFGSG